VAILSDINLLEILSDRSSNSDVLSDDPTQLNRWQRQEWLMWMGLLRLPKRYDRTFGTEWSDELSERLNLLIEKAEELKQES
jgi:hypothetical protein